MSIARDTRAEIDVDYLLSMLEALVEIPSPSGFTDNIVHFMGEELGRLGIEYELTRRGAIRANLHGQQSAPDRAIVSHLDTLGAMVTDVKPTGRLALAPIGTWSSRFAEGARVTVFTDEGHVRGTILPLMASGHAYGDMVDTQPVSWEHVEIRLDVRDATPEALARRGIQVGDFVALDPRLEVTEEGYVNSRHLDNKAGVACALAAAKRVVESKAVLPVDCHLLFTIFEEVGSGASAVLHQDVAEMVSIDNSTPAPGQRSSEREVTICMKDSSGPFDYHLTRKLARLARDNSIPIHRDVFRYYRCDAASAVEAGNDIRTALVCFGVDASHGYERTHLDCLRDLSRLLVIYAQSGPTFARDKDELGSLEDFPEQPQ